MDTPVKRYSSGMYVPLAFAVAAHRSAGRSRRSLEPEILLMDEVLVGRRLVVREVSSSDVRR